MWEREGVRGSLEEDTNGDRQRCEELETHAMRESTRQGIRLTGKRKNIWMNVRTRRQDRRTERDRGIAAKKDLFLFVQLFAQATDFGCDVVLQGARYEDKDAM